MKVLRIPSPVATEGGREKLESDMKSERSGCCSDVSEDESTASIIPDSHSACRAPSGGTASQGVEVPKC